jgi:hypothetical protein
MDDPSAITKSSLKGLKLRKRIMSKDTAIGMTERKYPQILEPN